MTVLLLDGLCHSPCVDVPVDHVFVKAYYMIVIGARGRTHHNFTKNCINVDSIDDAFFMVAYAFFSLKFLTKKTC